MSGYLVDTSVFIAAEQQRPLGDPPEGKARVSVATLMELLLGMRAASDDATRRVREATVAEARSFVPIPYDEPVAEALARIVHAARSEGRQASAEDSIIAATALVHDLTIWTQDDDFRVLAKLEPELRVHVG